MVHLIHYELKGHRPAEHYARLGQAIREISGSYCHTPESTWLVESGLPSMRIAERLAPFLFTCDPLMVIRVHKDYATYSFTAEQLNWLNARDYASAAETPVPFPFENVLGSSFKPLGGR